MRDSAQRAGCRRESELELALNIESRFQKPNNEINERERTRSGPDAALLTALFNSDGHVDTHN